MVNTPTTTGLAGLAWVDGVTTDKISIGAGDLTTSQIGTSTATIGIEHKDNTVQFPQGTDYALYAGENYTVTLLDSSVAVLAPAFNVVGNNSVIMTQGTGATGPVESDFVWVPFVDNVQHISQTVPNCQINTAETLSFGSGTVGNGGGNITINIQNMSGSTQDLNNLRQTILAVIQESNTRGGRI